MNIRFLETQEIETNLGLVQDLNPNIPRSALEDRLQAQIQEGVRFVGLFSHNQCIALAGFRIGTRFFCGKFIDIDTVLVHQAHRSQGLGKLLMRWLHDYAADQDCDVAVLDAYIENEPAHRFYAREGYLKKGYHHLKVLKANSPLGLTI